MAEQIVKNCQDYLKNRKLFCAFRISCHDLEIERGRYDTPPKLPEERICKLCQLQPETEEHFMLFCPRFYCI